MPKLIAALFCLSTAALAQAPDPKVEKPSPEAIRSFWAYYFRGQGQGPALAEAKLCLDLVREGKEKFECAKEVPASGIKAGASVFFWQAYLLPSGEVVDEITVQIFEGETLRETKDVKLKGEGIRTRYWTIVRIPKAGIWTLKLMRGAETLKSFTLTAS